MPQLKVVPAGGFIFLTVLSLVTVAVRFYFYLAAPPPPEPEPEGNGHGPLDRNSDVALMRRELDELKQAIREGMAAKPDKADKKKKKKS